MKPRSHPEWPYALAAFTAELDIPDRDYRVRQLISPGLGRLFMKDWIAQDRIDPEIMVDPADRSDDPRWHQIDGWPIRGGTADEILRRKWERRAALYFHWHATDVSHVTDWLIYATATNAPWLFNVSEQGEPRKLLKCGSLYQLANEADKGLGNQSPNWLLDRGGIPLDDPDPQPAPDDETEIADLGVGHVLVRLLTPNALRVEGVRMRHCVGHGGYDCILREPGYRLLSVRDPNGTPLATLEIRGDVVRQFRGPGNDDPTSAVVDLLSKYVAEQGWRGYEEAAVGRYGGYGPEALRVLEGLEPVRRRER